MIISPQRPIDPLWLQTIEEYNERNWCNIMLPLPELSPHEGRSHYREKIRVAMTVQKRISEILSLQGKGICYMVIEHRFSRVNTPIASNPVNYIADIYVKGRVSDKPLSLDLEIDGKKGHGTVYQQFKNEVRDEVITKKLHTKVIRIPLNFLGGFITHPGHSVIGRSFKVSPMTENEIITFIEEKGGINLSPNIKMGDRVITPRSNG